MQPPPVHTPPPKVPQMLSQEHGPTMMPAAMQARPIAKEAKQAQHQIIVEPHLGSFVQQSGEGDCTLIAIDTMLTAQGRVSSGTSDYTCVSQRSSVVGCVSLVIDGSRRHQFMGVVQACVVVVFKRHSFVL